MAHVVGFTNVEDAGQDGMELGSQKTLAGITGSRRVIKDRLGRIVEDIEAVREPHDGKDLTLSIDSKIQYIAFTQLKEAVEKNKAKAGGIIVHGTGLDFQERVDLGDWPDDVVPPGVSPFDMINRVRAAETLIEAFPGRIDHYAPWQLDREVSLLLRGCLDVSEGRRCSTRCHCRSISWTTAC